MIKSFSERSWLEPTYTWKEIKEKFPERLPHYKEKEIVTIRIFVDGNYLPGSYTFNTHLPYELSEKEMLLGKHEKRMIIALKSMRIDLVIETENNIWIVEVTQRLNSRTAGQLFVYKDLYKKIHKPVKPLKLGMVVREDNVILRDFIRANEIKLWVV